MHHCMFISESLSSVSRFCHTHCRFTETFFFFFLCAFIFGHSESSLLYKLFSSCNKWVYSLVVVHGLLMVVASLISEHRLWGRQASVAMAPGI